MDYNINYLVESSAEKLYIYPQENHFELGKLIFWLDEYNFCRQLMNEINAGIALIEIKNSNLVLQLKDGKKYEILLDEFNKSRENEILKKSLEKVKNKKLTLKAEPGGVTNGVFASVVISFCEVPSKESKERNPADDRFKKRKKAKLVKSAGRRWTDPK